MLKWMRRNRRETQQETNICCDCGLQLLDFRAYQNIIAVYFQMLDALLAEEKIPDEYSGQTQVCSALSTTVLAQCYERFTLMNCDTVMTARRKELLVFIGYIANAHPIHSIFSSCSSSPFDEQLIKFAFARLLESVSWNFTP
ncbi:hypothetical protein D5086_023341 [Populus alba]|uniref:Uncharacterized protein n=1 Tax=Populus alba TaxID=43335 RepID=A0ACC4B9I8_POPAL